VAAYIAAGPENGSERPPAEQPRRGPLVRHSPSPTARPERLPRKPLGPLPLPEPPQPPKPSFRDRCQTVAECWLALAAVTLLGWVLNSTGL
jgi:hypothetical protein